MVGFMAADVGVVGDHSRIIPVLCTVFFLATVGIFGGRIGALISTQSAPDSYCRLILISYIKKNVEPNRIFSCRLKSPYIKYDGS